MSFTPIDAEDSDLVLNPIVNNGKRVATWICYNVRCRALVYVYGETNAYKCDMCGTEKIVKQRKKEEFWMDEEVCKWAEEEGILDPWTANVGLSFGVAEFDLPKMEQKNDLESRRLKKEARLKKIAAALPPPTHSGAHQLSRSAENKKSIFDMVKDTLIKNLSL